MKRQHRSSCAITRMGATTIVLALISFASNQIQAQDTRRSWGQVFGAAGAITESGDSEAVLHFGGGYESLLAGGAGVTGEIGYLTVFDNFSAGIGVFSVGGLYAFNRDRTTVPFVTGGYTLFFRSGTANGLFFGGGVNRWMGDKWGIRIEGRDQVFASDTGVHTIEVRFGVILK